MFDNYIKEHQNLLPLLLKYEQEKFPLNIPSFNGDGENFQEFITKYNADKWREELYHCAEEIKYSYSYFRTYIELQEIYSNDLSSSQYPRNFELLTFEIPLWTSIVLNIMYSFREKFAHFIFELYERQLFHPKNSELMLTHENLRFFLLFDALKKDEMSDRILTVDDSEKVISIFKSLCLDQFEWRNKFIHRSMLAIDTLGSGASIIGGKMVSDNKFELSIENEPQFNCDQIKNGIMEVLEAINKSIDALSKLSIFIP